MWAENITQRNRVKIFQIQEKGQRLQVIPNQIHITKGQIKDAIITEM